MYKGLLLSEPFGLGHTMAARAILEGMQTIQPTWELEMLELSKGLSPMLSRTLASLYIQMLKLSPSIWAKMYQHGQFTTKHQKLTYLLKKLLYRDIDTLLSTRRPDFIICTHPFPSMILAELKERYGFKLYNCVTDYGLHGSWVNPGVDHYFVPANQVMYELMQCGIKQTQITVSGLPIRLSFSKQVNQQQAQAYFGLSSKPTLLCLGGGLGLGLDTNGYSKIFAPLLDKVQVVIVTGKNNKLFQEWSDHPIARHSNLHIYSYIEQMHLLMAASSLILTKPGAITCTEALAKKKPTLLLNPVPGQEEKNLHFLQQHRLGLHLVDHNHMVHTLNFWIEKPNAFTAQFSLNQYPYDPAQVITSFMDRLAEDLITTDLGEYAKRIG